MRPLLRIFRVMAAGHCRWLVAGVVTGVAVIATNIALMAVSGWFIASMAIAGLCHAPFNYGIPAAAIRALALVRTLGRYADRLLNHEAAFRMLADLRSWLFAALIPLAPAGLESYAGGDISGRLRADVDHLENLWLRLIAPIVTGVVVLLLAPAFLLFWSPPAALVLFAALCCAGLLVPVIVLNMAEQPGRGVVKRIGELRVRVTEGLQGAEELLLLGVTADQALQVDELYREIAAGQRKLGSISGVATAGTLASAGFALAGVLVVATADFAAGVSGPVLVMLLLFVAASFEGIAPLAAALQTYPAVAATAGRLVDLADAPCPVPEQSIPCFPGARHDISFADVSFAYGSGSAVLSGFSMEVAGGSCVALTGASGAGKSSVMELLLRFRPYAGSITIGGAEVRDIPSEAVASLITAVPQRPHLFSGTIRSNILLGAPDADEDCIVAALEIACLNGWVSDLPNGLDTVVDAAGCNLSGGEVKRIALARALLHDAPVLLLDEPTEGLDSDMERRIVEQLRPRLCGKTVLLASHRPACLALADRIVTLPG